jgi:hypothetical protein
MRDIIHWVFNCHAINYAFWVSHLGRVFFHLRHQNGEHVFPFWRCNLSDTFLKRCPVFLARINRDALIYRVGARIDSRGCRRFSPEEKIRAPGLIEHALKNLAFGYEQFRSNLLIQASVDIAKRRQDQAEILLAAKA